MDQVKQAPPTWTPERDAILIEAVKLGFHADDIARTLDISSAAVRGRASRLGVRFERKNTRKRPAANPNGLGHKPFTEKCGELLRAAGVRI